MKGKGAYSRPYINCVLSGAAARTGSLKEEKRKKYRKIEEAVEQYKIIVATSARGFIS